MNNDTTSTLEEKLIQCQVAFDLSLHKAHEDANRQGQRINSQHLRWMHEDYAKEIERITEDDFIETPDAWERIGVWSIDEPELHAVIGGMRRSGYHYVRMSGYDADTKEPVVMLYRKAAQS